MADAKSKFLNLDAILAAPDVRESEVEVPEWGGKVKIRSLTKAAQVSIRKKSTGRDGTIDEFNMEGRLLVAGLVEPEVNENQISELFEKSSSAVDRVLQAILGVSGMDEDAVSQADKSLKS